MKRFLSLLLTLVLALGLASPAMAADTDYRDVPATHWAYDEIQAMTALGVVEGVGSQTFRPANQVTTGQFATMVVRAFYEEEASFVSSPVSDWWGTYMLVAQAMGLLDGTTAGYSYYYGTWDPAIVNAPMTRYDMAQVMYNTLRDQGASMPRQGALTIARQQIPDYNSIPLYYRSAVENMYAMSCLSGLDSSGTFGGDHTMNRAQACRVMYNLYSVLDPSAVTPTTPEPAPQPQVTLANGQAITDDNIRSIIYGLKAEYPEGRTWTNANGYFSEATYIMGYGCAGFALICTDAVFGDLPITSTHSDFDKIRVGDMLRVNNDTHSVVVLYKKDNSVIVTEGNYNSSIHWDREISRQSLESGNFYCQSRYPL